MLFRRRFSNAFFRDSTRHCAIPNADVRNSVKQGMIVKENFTLKIIYRYRFHVTKTLIRGELIPCVLTFIENNALMCKHILFDLHSFKSLGTKRKQYLEKLVENDPFWVKSEVPCEFDKLTSKISLLGTYAISDKATVIAELTKPMAEMPATCSYTICFDGMDWFDGRHGSDVADLSQYETPLTSNITIYNYAYNDTSYISLSFLMNEAGTEHITFVDRFSAHLSGLPYQKEIDFVLDDTEKAFLHTATEQAKQVLNGREYVDISTESNGSDQKDKLKLKESIKNIFDDFHFVSCMNGVYEVWKTDAYRNKLSVVLDYDRENHCFMAALFYIGAGIKTGVQYSEIQELHSNATLFDYLTKVCDDVRAFEHAHAPRLAALYPKLPGWFEW